MRDPTPVELEMVLNMGFDQAFAVAAVQMANYDPSRAIELLISG